MLQNAVVVLVDRSRTVRRIVGQIIKDELECENLIEFAEADTAWSQISSGEINADWIISGWELEGLSGFDFLTAVRENKSTANIPFIMITSHDDRDSIIRALNAGVTDYLIKPFTHQQLLEDVQRVVSLKYRRKTARYKTVDRNPVRLNFSGDIYRCSLMDISSGDFLVKTPVLNNTIISVYDEAQVMIDTGEDVKLTARLFRMERTPNLNDRENIYAAFTITNISDEDNAMLDRFIDSVAGAYAGF